MNTHHLLAMNYQYLNQMNYLKNAINERNQRLSTGKRINSASDDPSVMLRMNRLESHIRGSQVGQSNIQDGIAYLDTRDTGLAHAAEIGKNLRDLAVHYQNDTLTNEERHAIVSAANEYFKELDYIGKHTQFNKKNVFSGEDIVIQTSPNASDTFTIKSSSVFPLESSPQKENGIYRVKTNTIEQPKLNQLQSMSLFNQDSVEPPKIMATSLLGIDVGKGLVGLVDGLLGTDLGGNNPPNEPTPSEPAPSEPTPQNPPLAPEPPNESPGANTPIDEGDEPGIGIPEESLPSDETNPIEEESQLAQILNTDFIDRYILNPIAAQRSEVGVQRNILEHRLNFERKQNEIRMVGYSRIQDVDVARELFDKAKEEMLLNMNTLLLQENNDPFRTSVMQLLYSK